MLKARIKTIRQILNSPIVIKTLIFDGGSELATAFMGREVEVQMSDKGRYCQAIFDKGTGNEFILDVKREWLTELEIDWTQVPDNKIVEVKCLNPDDPRWFLGTVKRFNAKDFVLDLVKSCPYIVNNNNIHEFEVRFIDTEDT